MSAIPPLSGDKQTSGERTKNDAQTHSRPSSARSREPTQGPWCCLHLPNASSLPEQVRVAAANRRPLAILPISSANSSAWLLGVHQYEQNSAWTYAVVHPGMVRRLLHDHVALLEMHAGIVKHHIDLSGEDYHVVEATCAMHQRVLDWNAFGRRVRDPLLDHFGRKLC